MRGFSCEFVRKLESGWNHADEGTVVAALDLELNLAVGFCVQGVILAASNVITGVELGAALTHQDISWNDNLATEFLDAKAFGF